MGFSHDMYDRVVRKGPTQRIFGKTLTIDDVADLANLGECQRVV